VRARARADNLISRAKSASTGSGFSNHDATGTRESSPNLGGAARM
jgi:hypothetical protein